MFIVNPRVDFAFKKLFGSVENKDILMAFINAIVSEQDRVQDIELLNPYNHKDHRQDKLSILDIKAIDQQGQYYNIEIQLTDQVYYNQRALYYWSKLYTSQLQEGDAFSDLKKTISIHVLNFNYFANEAHYHNIFKLLNIRSYQSHFEDLELHFIELNKFDDSLTNLKNTLDRWVKFLKRASYYEPESFPKELKVDPAIVKAFKQLQTLSLDTEEREIYEARLKWLRDEAAALMTAEQKGMQKGMQEGIQEGIRQGIQQVVLRQLQRGVAIETIMQDTGLTHDEIMKIQQN